MKNLLSIILMLVICSCTKNTSLDQALKCQDYILLNEEKLIFTTSYDYACMYNPSEGNPYGIIETYITPKNTKYFEGLKIDSAELLEEYVNNLSIENIKKEFDIKLFLIDKSYLDKIDSDSPYVAAEKYQKDFYVYNSDEKSWDKIDSFKVNTVEDIQLDIKWKNEKVDSNYTPSPLEEHAFLVDSISRLKIDSHWNKEYNLWLSSYTHNYNYAYKVNVSKDSTYIKQRSLNDLLVSFQKKDTLFLYHKKALIEDYVEDKTKPELKIVHINGKYYINSSLFDLENSISDKPTKYGFLVDEIN